MCECVCVRASHDTQLQFSHSIFPSSENPFEPIDVEDDPNMLNEEMQTDAINLHSENAAQRNDAMFKGKFKRDKVEFSQKDEINLRVSKDKERDGKEEEKKALRYAFD